MDEELKLIKKIYENFNKHPLPIRVYNELDSNKRAKT